MVGSRSLSEKEKAKIRTRILRFCEIPRKDKEIISKFKSDTLSGISVGAYVSYLRIKGKLLYDHEIKTNVRVRVK